jgi:hypothetical protein
MPAINQDFLTLLHDDYTKYKSFIETGTYFGETTFSVEPLFNTIYTIEVKENLYNDVKAKYNGNKINFLLGDSSIVFESLLPTITEKSIFFLDGHWSAGITGKGAKDCPLIEEITYINNLYKHEGIIIIDDYRLFGKGPNKKSDECDWEDISKDRLTDILSKRITQVYHLPSEHDVNDRLIIHINAAE